MGAILRMLRFARPWGGIIPKYLVLIIGATIFSVINLTVIIPLLQVLFDQVAIPEESVSAVNWNFAELKNSFYAVIQSKLKANGQLSALYFICIFLVISVLLANVFRYFSQLVLAQVRVRVIKNLRSQAFQQLMNYDLQMIRDSKKGDLVSRITTDVQEVEQSVVNSLKVLFKEPFLIVGYFLAMLAISPSLTLYTLLLVPVAGYVVSLVAKRVKKWARQSQDTLGELGSMVDETISGYKVIQLFGAQKIIFQRFSNALSAFANQTYQIASRSNLSAPISELMGTMVLALLMLIGGGLVLSDPPSLSAASFIGFLIIFSQVLNPAKAISVALSQINKGMAAADRVFELMDQRPVDSDYTLHKTLPENWEQLHFDAVSFSYGDQKILSDISFTLSKNQQVALVGPSGSGKSTLVDLLCGFHNPSHGAILLDQHSISLFAKAEWQKMIAIVTQEPILFHDSIYENIAMGKPGASKEEIMSAAKQANAHDFIMEQLNGYDTIIGDQGNKLSGGQKQRIAIARAILKNAPILILDEATSSLDAQTADLVYEALSRLMENRATITIAHQLHTIRSADHILVLQAGKIVQQGNHEQLQSQKGLYQELTSLSAF